MCRCLPAVLILPSGLVTTIYFCIIPVIRAQRFIPRREQNAASVETIRDAVPFGNVASDVGFDDSSPTFCIRPRCPRGKRRGAVDMIASGEKRSVDVGEVNGEIFINNSSIGIYPYPVPERERRRRRKRLSKWTAIVLGLPRVLRHLPRAEARACLSETTSIVS